MKKLSYYLLLMTLFFWVSMYAISERMRPVQYSSTAGRMIYVPHPTWREVPPTAQQFEQQRAREILDRQQEQMQLDEAFDRNQRLRLWQLQRSGRRRYGSYNDYRGSAAEPPITVTPETMPY